MVERHRWLVRYADLLMAQELAKKTSVMQPLKEDRFLCGFSHIFAGGYSAGALSLPPVVLYSWLVYQLVLHTLTSLEAPWLYVGQRLLGSQPPSYGILLMTCRHIDGDVSTNPAQATSHTSGLRCYRRTLSPHLRRLGSRTRRRWQTQGAASGTRYIPTTSDLFSSLPRHAAPRNVHIVLQAVPVFQAPPSHLSIPLTNMRRCCPWAAASRRQRCSRCEVILSRMLLLL